MKSRNGLELSAKYYGTKVVSATYKGLKLIWEAVNSCFGSGYWIKSKGWSRNDAWRRNV